MVAHFARLAADSPVPLIVYNIPYRTGTALSVQTLLRLASTPGIAGVKHAVGAIRASALICTGAFADLIDAWHVASGRPAS